MWKAPGNTLCTLGLGHLPVFAVSCPICHLQLRALIPRSHPMSLSCSLVEELLLSLLPDPSGPVTPEPG